MHVCACMCARWCSEQDVFVSILNVWAEESKKHCHPMSSRLGSYSMKNHSRDFWTNCGIPVVAGSQGFFRNSSVTQMRLLFGFDINAFC